MASPAKDSSSNAMLSMFAQITVESRTNTVFGACKNGNAELVDTFLSERYVTDVGQVNEANDSFLTIACRNLQFHVVKVLLKHGADPNHPSSPIAATCNNGSPAKDSHIIRILILSVLLKHGADINQQTGIVSRMGSISDKVGTTALCIA